MTKIIVDTFQEQSLEMGTRIHNVYQHSTGTVLNMSSEVFIYDKTIYAKVKGKSKPINEAFICLICIIALATFGLLVCIQYKVPLPAELLSRSFLDNVGFLCFALFVWFYVTLYNCQITISDAERKFLMRYIDQAKRSRGRANKSRKLKNIENSFNNDQQFVRVEFVRISQNKPYTHVSFFNLESRKNQAGAKESTIIPVKNTEEAPIEISKEQQTFNFKILQRKVEDGPEHISKKHQSNHFKIVKRKVEAGPELIYHASLYGHKEVVRKLLNKYCPFTIDITHKEEVTGFTVFHLACSGGHLSVVQQLMKAYGNEVCIGLLNRELQTGLELAARYGRKDVVKTILNSIKQKHVRYIMAMVYLIKNLFLDGLFLNNSLKHC